MARRLAGLVAMCAAMLAWGGRASAAGTNHYELKFERASSHLMDVTITAEALTGATVDFAIPDWAPGSYYIQNYSANVQGFRAHTPEGKELAWRKTDSQTWRIALAGAKSVVVEYTIYANTLQNNVAQYNERHAFLGGPSVWMYQTDGKDRGVTLSIAVPNGWRVATGMNHTSATTFDAPNYDTFADCPLEISDFQEKDFEVQGTKYHVIVHDIIGQKDFTKFTNDLQKIVATIVPMFKTVAGSGDQAAPFQDYYFIFHVWPKAGGGLEHLYSTQINFRTDWDSEDPAGDYGSQYELKLFVAAHEFFHAWNVKRLRPRPLGPFDYTQMAHTPSLWISEGLTSYYGELAVERTGLITPQEYLDSMGKLITKFEADPGRSERSIEDTSWDTWYNGGVIKQDNNLANTNYSYYDGGQIMGHILDFAIRQATNNQKTLDDWMRLLYLRYALPNPGFEPEDPVRAANEVAGKDLSGLFQKYISGKEPIPYEEYFGYAGIEVTKKLDTTKPWVGLETDKTDAGQTTIKNVIPGSPAEIAGLEKNDTILAVDGRTGDPDTLTKIFAGHKPGDTIRVTVERLGHVEEIAVTAKTSPYYTYTLKPMEKMSPQQKTIYDSWISTM
ncbi:MAG TPA: PDZ domain-containing protein [Candidatus Micrarchaeaceae archaeon]|nr:PDZ domain-containing protein [Candidatus Micrarchaeaceae archaeon]